MTSFSLVYSPTLLLIRHSKTNSWIDRNQLAIDSITCVESAKSGKFLRSNDEQLSINKKCPKIHLEINEIIRLDAFGDAHRIENSVSLKRKTLGSSVLITKNAARSLEYTDKIQGNEGNLCNFLSEKSKKTEMDDN